MTDYTQGSAGFHAANFNSGVTYVPNLGASMPIRDGGTIYVSFTGGSTTTSSTQTAVYNSVEILNDTGGVLASIRLPFSVANANLENYLIRIPNVWGARTIMWRIAARGNDAAYSTVSNMNVTVNWNML